jgi:hypothetical protein
VVAQRLRLQERIYQPMITDPTLRSAQGMSLLAQTSRREANVRAFNDVFALSGVLAVAFLLWSLLAAIRSARRKKKEEEAIASTPAPSGAPAN